MGSAERHDVLVYGQYCCVFVGVVDCDVGWHAQVRRWEMTTSSPIRKVHDVPIVRPVRTCTPRQLPSPDERTWVPVMPFVPDREKVKVEAK